VEEKTKSYSSEQNQWGVEVLIKVGETRNPGVGGALEVAVGGKSRHGRTSTAKKFGGNRGGKGKPARRGKNASYWNPGRSQASGRVLTHGLTPVERGPALRQPTHIASPWKGRGP